MCSLSQEFLTVQFFVKFWYSCVVFFLLASVQLEVLAVYAFLAYISSVQFYV